MKEVICLDENGAPTNIEFPIKYIKNYKHPGITKTKEHPIWKYDNKPWTVWGVKSKVHSSAELHYCYKTASRLGGNIANLGTYKGSSAAAFAFGLKNQNAEGKVYAVDLFNVNGATSPEELKDKLNRFELSDYVKICQGYTYEWAERLKHLRFNFILIDADHNYETCKLDFKLWSPLLTDCGEVSFHDCNMTTVDKVIREELTDSWEQVDHVYRLRTFKRK